MFPNAFVFRSISCCICVWLLYTLVDLCLSATRGSQSGRLGGEQTIVAMDTGQSERSQRSTCMLGKSSPRWSHPLIRRERAIVFPLLFLKTTHLHKQWKKQPDNSSTFLNFTLKAIVLKVWKRAKDHWTPFRRRQEPTEATQHLVLWKTWTYWQQRLL